MPLPAVSPKRDSSCISRIPHSSHEHRQHHFQRSKTTTPSWDSKPERVKQKPGVPASHDSYTYCTDQIRCMSCDPRMQDETSLCRQGQEGLSKPLQAVLLYCRSGVMCECWEFSKSSDLQVFAFTVARSSRVCKQLRQVSSR